MCSLYQVQVITNNSFNSLKIHLNKKSLGYTKIYAVQNKFRPLISKKVKLKPYGAYYVPYITPMFDINLVIKASFFSFYLTEFIITSFVISYQSS